MSLNEGKITYINGPVVKGNNMSSFKLREMVLVGKNKLIGEVISVFDDNGTLQVYEETEGLELNEIIKGLNNPLSLKLGPGLIGNIFDGVYKLQRSLNIRLCTSCSVIFLFLYSVMLKRSNQ